MERFPRPWRVTAYSGAEKPTAPAYRVIAPDWTSYEASAPTRKPSRPTTVSAVKVGPLKRSTVALVWREGCL